MPAKTIIAVVTLTLVAVAGTALVSVTWQQTNERIARNEREWQLRALNEIVPPDSYDNDIFGDTTTALDPDLLGSPEPVMVYRARQDGEPVAAILTPIAPDGYSAAIVLLVGIYADGTLAGVRAAEHRETAGLGDGIDADKSDWVLQFDGLSLTDPIVEQWAVRADGGVFDQFTGATVTPRAVVKGVRNALLYFDAHREELFAETGPDTSDEP